MFRSESIVVKQIIFSKDSLWENLNFLANYGNAMFYTNKDSLRKTPSVLWDFSVHKLKKLENIFAKIRYIEEKMVEFKIPIMNEDKLNQNIIIDIDNIFRKRGFLGEKIFLEQEEQFKQIYISLAVQIESYNSLIKNRERMLEKREAQVMINKLENTTRRSLEDIRDAVRQSSDSKRFHCITGIITNQNFVFVQKIIFRLSKENMLIRKIPLFVPYDIDLQGVHPVPKVLAFILIPHSEEEIIKNKVTALLDQYGFLIVDYDQEIEILELDLEENKKILSSTLEEIIKTLKRFSVPASISDVSYIKELKIILEREKNFLKKTRYIEEKGGLYFLSIWISKSNVQLFLDYANDFFSQNFEIAKPQIMNFEIEETSPPILKPTKIVCNSLLQPFQEIVNTYGIPRYKEINPAVFIITSFSFFFGVMFGDVGHGILLIALALHISYFRNLYCLNIYKLKYLLLLLGFFSVYCGLIYNEFFSVPLILFKSCWNKTSSTNVLSRKQGCVYPFGVDWKWFQAHNETVFINSFKMKFSIILGILQMFLGITLKMLNFFYDGNKVGLIFEAFPQFIFMLLSLGYMVFCIVSKWLIDWSRKDPPSIISILINFHQSKTTIIFSIKTQHIIHCIFILVIFLSALIILLGKPIIIYASSKSFKNIYIESSPKENNTCPESQYHRNNKLKHESDLLELLVHQMTETVEFILGTVSHTASYLRLWALSLAHAQLSKVFLNMIFANSLSINYSLIAVTLRITLGFLFWILITFTLILAMDGMECFLHSLRLHWVEFQSKFFKGDGYIFKEFKHKF